jgi:glycosyltransferase involved in cell wall biosynthesis
MYISFILPCRNEERTLKKCITQIRDILKEENIQGEIIVSDSSDDRSPIIARKSKVTLIKHNEKGYGIAIRRGFEKSKGDIIVIGDADGTYDFSSLPQLIKKAANADLVIGSRLKGNIANGAMPWHHRYIGNPFLSGLLNILFGTYISDAHSGFRLIKRNAFEKLELKTTGMEFASEMIIKAAKNKMTIVEVPIDYFPRVGKSKLNSFSDGWRHLRFMLMFSPTYLFFIPGFFLMLMGTIILFLNNSFFAPLLTLLGYQLISLGLYSRIYCIHTGFEKEDRFIDFIASKFPLERGILLSILFFISGTIAFRFRPLLALTLAIICFQTFFSVFFISMMLVEKSEI